MNLHFLKMVLYETEEIHSILYKVTRHLPNMDLINVDKLPCTKADFVNTYNGEMFTCSKSDPVLCILYTSGSTGKTFRFKTRNLVPNVEINTEIIKDNKRKPFSLQLHRNTQCHGNTFMGHFWPQDVGENLLSVLISHAIGTRCLQRNFTVH